MYEGKEARKHPRSRSHKEGKIVFNAGYSLIDCIIRNRSESGAKLTVPAATVFPKSIALLSVSEGKLYPAEVMWRRGDELGVMFIGAPSASPSGKR